MKLLRFFVIACSGLCLIALPAPQTTAGSKAAKIKPGDDRYEIVFDFGSDNYWSIDGTRCQVNFTLHLKSVNGQMYGVYKGKSTLSSEGGKGPLSSVAMDMESDELTITIPFPNEIEDENGKLILPKLLPPGKEREMYVYVRGTIKYHYTKLNTAFGGVNNPDNEVPPLPFLLRGPLPKDTLRPPFKGHDLFFELKIPSFQGGKLVFPGLYINNK